MDANDKIFDLDEDFWDNYLKGRPQPPDSFFDRIFSYHQAQGGKFGTVHDVGAGNGPYARRLRAKFDHVIVSDISARNIEFARARLGSDGFSYRVAKVEDADDVANASVDMVFATNMMHFADQHSAMSAIAKQLTSGGTFACAGYGTARFQDAELQDIWTRINHHGGRVLIDRSDQPERTIAIMGRTQDRYNVAPLDSQYFRSGAQRIRLNLERGGVAEMIPPEKAHLNIEPDHTGSSDIEIFEHEGGWYFETDLEGVRDHIASFPYLMEDPVGSAQLFQDLEDLMRSKKIVRGHWPANMILATRR